MRVLLAMDGSTSADTARNLVASLVWPQATLIRVVAVVEPMSAVLVGLSPYSATEIDDPRIAGSLERRLAETAAMLADPGRIIETQVLRGRPASEIVDQASELRAHLIVMGSRGLGRLRSMLVGSVSAEVVDHAPCPVLVARASSIGHVLVAVDGSDSARRAVEALADATYLAGHRLHVLTVGPLLRDGLPDRDAARAAEELARAGYDVDWTIAAGDAAHEIIDAAQTFSCDLIVMGSRGLTGLDRLLLGSVARKVLLHSPASVLIVREPVRQRTAEPGRHPAVQPALSPAG